MPATPRRKVTSDQTQSPAQSLVGRSVAIPSDIFKEGDSRYTGKVVGTPRRKNAVYVKVDQDATEYWFPADEVAKWVVDDPKHTATAVMPRTPRSRKHANRTDSPQGVSTAASSQPAKAAGRHKRQAVQTSDTQPQTPVVETVAQQIQDAASCHPEKPDAFVDTIEELVRPMLMLFAFCRPSVLLRKMSCLQAAASADEIFAGSQSPISLACQSVSLACKLYCQSFL